MTIADRLKKANHNLIIVAILVVSMVLNTITLSWHFATTGQLEESAAVWQTFTIVGLLYMAYKI